MPEKERSDRSSVCRVSTTPGNRGNFVEFYWCSSKI